MTFSARTCLGQNHYRQHRFLSPVFAFAPLAQRLYAQAADQFAQGPTEAARDCYSKGGRTSCGVRRRALSAKSLRMQMLVVGCHVPTWPCITAAGGTGTGTAVGANGSLSSPHAGSVL